jgi:phosphate-selective porin OprO/OprP
VPRARVGIKGAVFHRVEYEVERDFQKANVPWRDVYLNVPLRRALEVKAGRFKIPFSLDQLTSGASLDLVYRSLAATYLAPGRDVGVMAHGRLFGRRVSYQAGAFRQGGDNVRASELLDPHSGGALAGRAVVRPWSDSGTPRALRNLSIAAAATFGNVPEGEYSVRGHTIADVAFFPNIPVRGLRRRYGGEIDWRAGPVALRSELIQAMDQRLGQSTDDRALPDILARGWYLSGTWLLTGEKKTDEVRPAKPFLQGGVGALEMAARFEDLGFASRHSDLPAAQGPRNSCATGGAKMSPSRAYGRAARMADAR